ncbi:MBL fold metallo-hydrolase [Candidatus Acetothermia bacterium]|nr:MBL fold metallo-hydrolase [Candidatus Acetothermia bacterium]MBI3659387.1 MBL fold metallo-hydrolase [Candidatus Acetothermia bacterium]
MGQTQIVLLGTGTPIADPDRSGPSVAIIVNDQPYLVDFGPGMVRRAAAAHRAGVKGLTMQKLTRAFVTHLHSDHTAGYPDLILTPWVLGRNEPLQVYGPLGIKKMTEHILTAYERDIYVRTSGLEPGNKEGYKVHAHEIGPELIYQDERVKVIAFFVKHGSFEPAFGFRFETPGRTIIISGDTVPVPSLIEHVRGCDVLIHEVYSVKGFATRPPEWQKYHSSFHTSSHELAEIAKQVKPGLLVLYHQLFWGTTEENLLAEIQEIYDGPVVSGKDLDVF